MDKLRKDMEKSGGEKVVLSTGLKDKADDRAMDFDEHEEDDEIEFDYDGDDIIDEDEDEDDDDGEDEEVASFKF